MAQTVNPESFRLIFDEAKAAAEAAANDFFQNQLGGEDKLLCGFAWCSVFDIKLSTKLGKAMAACGFTKEYGGGIQYWNPSGHNCQNVDTKYAGAAAFAKVLTKYGFKAYANSRLD